MSKTVAMTVSFTITLNQTNNNQTMKNLVKIITAAGITAIVIIATSNASHGQAIATAQADAHATIVTPISIIKVADMEFGNIAVGALSGSVDLAATGAGTRTPGGGVSLPAVAGTVNAASYTISGQANYIYGITLPVSITIANGANSMTINNVNSLPAVSTGGQLNGSGTETLYVGGTLAVNASQAAGVYSTAATFPVTVVYN